MLLCFLDRGRVQPEEQIIKVGVDAVFICHSNNNVPLWNYDGTVLPSNAETTSGGYKLRIRKVQNSNRGYYHCEGTTDKAKRFVSRGLLKILGKIIVLHNTIIILSLKPCTVEPH